MALDLPPDVHIVNIAHHRDDDAVLRAQADVRLDPVVETKLALNPDIDL